MKIDILDNTSKSLRLKKLKPGDFFVRNAANRPLEGRVVYMLLWPHTRLDGYKNASYELWTVSLHNGRLCSMTDTQRVLKVKGPLEVELDL